MAIKDTTESFIAKAKGIHGSKYDYSLVEYVNSRKKVKVVCKKHGVFEISPDNHLNQKYGCSFCGKETKKKKLSSSRREFIKKARRIHGNKYKYSLVEYKNMKTLIKIICEKHGEFEITPRSHIYDKRGCIYCQQEKEVTTKEIIKRFKQQHGDKYDYSKVVYKRGDVKVKIICKKHGEFLQTPNSHTAGKGCSKCYGNKPLIKIEFIAKANEVHNEKYDYSLINDFKHRSVIEIICPLHGSFIQRSNNHLNGQGCPKCANNNQYSNASFIKQANKIHDNKFNYSNVNYSGAHTKVKIICSKHGEFEQTPASHLQGIGCPICNESKGERVIRNWLQDNKVVFKAQKKFKECKNINQLPFDFYLPELNTCIEYDGEQHFKPINRFGGIKKFEKTQQNDLIKEAYCKDNKIKLIRVPYTQIKSVDEVLSIEIL